MSLFINVLPLECSLRVLDLVFSEGIKVIYRIYLALFKLYKEELKKMTSQEMLMFVRDMP